MKFTHQSSNKLLLLVINEAILFTVDVYTYIINYIIQIYCSKIARLCLVPIKRLAILPSNNYEVRVLLHELYPDRGQILGPTAFRRNDLTNLDDYLIALQKIGLDDVGDLQLDELNFLFQTNHLPISVFQTTSTDQEVDSHYTCRASSSLNVNAWISSPTTSIPADNGIQSHLIDKKCKPLSTNSVINSANNEVLKSISVSKLKEKNSDKVGSMNGFKNHLLNEKPSKCIIDKINSSKITSTKGPPLCCDSSISDISSENASANSCYNTIDTTPLFKRRSKYTTESSCSSSCEESSYTSNTIFKVLPNSKIQLFDEPSVKKSTGNRTPTSAHGIWKLKPQLLSSQMTSAKFDPPPSIASIDWSQFEKVDEHLQTSKLSDAYHHDYSSDNSDDAIEGHSSDSDFYNQHLYNFKRKTRSDCNTIEWDSNNRRSSSCGSSHNTFQCNCSDGSGALDTCFSVDLSDSEHADRHIRDIKILNHLKVPFTYDEIAYSTNEHFREIKSTIGLSIDQISAMLNARRRATNRQAAERCRRVKSAARSSLSIQLDRLRLERTTLSKRLMQTRRRRQQARDMLTMAQQDCVNSLIGPDGRKLDPSMWRLQTTAQGELIVVQIESKS